MTQTLGSGHSVPVYSVYIRANIQGVAYDLTIGLLQYHGPDTYEARRSVLSITPLPYTLPAHPTPGLPTPTIGGTTSTPAVSLATLFRDPPKGSNALGEIDDNQVATITVASGQDHGTISATFGPIDFRQIPVVLPSASHRVSVTGDWSCGAFPIHPNRPSTGP